MCMQARCPHRTICGGHRGVNGPPRAGYRLDRLPRPGALPYVSRARGGHEREPKAEGRRASPRDRSGDLETKTRAFPLDAIEEIRRVGAFPGWWREGDEQAGGIRAGLDREHGEAGDSLVARG